MNCPKSCLTLTLHLHLERLIISPRIVIFAPAKLNISCAHFNIQQLILIEEGGFSVKYWRMLISYIQHFKKLDGEPRTYMSCHILTSAPVSFKITLKHQVYTLMPKNSLSEFL